MKVEIVETESEGKQFTKTERAHVLCRGHTAANSFFSTKTERVLVCTQLMMYKGRISSAGIR